MKFGFVGYKTDNFNVFLSQFYACGINLALIKKYSIAKDEGNSQKAFEGCNVVFGAGERQWFLETFDLEDKGENSFCKNAVVYIFLKSADEILSIESSIKRHFCKLNINISVYRMFLEADKADALEAALRSEIDCSKEKMLLDIQKNGLLFDVIVGYRSDCRSININKIILEGYFDCVYATSFIPLFEVVGSILLKSGLKLRLAESFTGGGLAASLVRVAGASSFLIESLVTYTDEAKINRLFLKEDMLSMEGAITAQAAAEMAKSLYISGCDIAVATTGNAGPTSQKGGDVGKCFIGIVMGNKVEVCEYNFSGSREEITKSGIDSALFLLYRKLMLSYTR